MNAATRVITARANGSALLEKINKKVNVKIRSVTPGNKNTTPRLPCVFLLFEFSVSPHVLLIFSAAEFIPSFRNDEISSFNLVRASIFFWAISLLIFAMRSSLLSLEGVRHLDSRRNMYKHEHGEDNEVQAC